MQFYRPGNGRYHADPAGECARRKIVVRPERASIHQRAVHGARPVRSAAEPQCAANSKTLVEPVKILQIDAMGKIAGAIRNAGPREESSAIRRIERKRGCTYMLPLGICATHKIMTAEPLHQVKAGSPHAGALVLVSNRR